MPTDNMKALMESIPLPDELRERAGAGIAAAAAARPGFGLLRGRRSQRPARRRALAIAAALLALLVLSAGIANHDRVWAALRKTFQFAPGTGVVTEEESPSERYVLKKPIVLKVYKGEVTITGMVVGEDMTYITMAGKQAPRVEQLDVVNGQGKQYTIERSMGSWGGDEWTASFWHKGKLDLSGEVKLVLPLPEPVETSAVLERADGAASYAELGKTATAGGLSVTAIADRVGDRARISLVAPPQESYWINSYGIGWPIRYGSEDQLSVQDEAGRPLEVTWVRGTGAPQSELYFPLSERQGAKYVMTIPEISVLYRGEATVKVPTTSQDALNKTFDIAGFPVTITKTERIGTDALRIYTDLHWDAKPDRSLYNLDIEGKGGMAKLSESTGAVEYMEFEIKPDSKEVKLTFVRPYVAIRGPWTFEWSADEIKP
ncbi:hypothetical protein [Cohnella sp. 56]|uniref:hypothetical protein n=1 Tax=Cohnella sp. 56 TaxID=3113722 RepID=UPI0030E92FD8